MNADPAIASCEEGYERCRLRSSIHAGVSTVLFIGIAGRVLFSALPIKSVRQIFPILAQAAAQKGGPDLTSGFYWCFVIPLVFVLGLHLLRVYFSLLIMDEDPEFYGLNLRRLSRTKRVLEYVFRLCVFVMLAYFLVHSRPGQTVAGATGRPMSQRFFFPIVLVYVTLIVWDLLMCFFIGFGETFGRHRGTHASRISFMINDVVGLIMSAIMLALEARVVEQRSLMLLAAIMLALAFVGSVSLLWDSLRGGRKNLGKYWSHLSAQLRGVVLAPCGTHLPLTGEQCPHIQP